MTICRNLFPTFVVIGAMRCGTTSLHSFLDQHPDIFMSAIKGPALFMDVEDPIEYPSSYTSIIDKRGGLADRELLARMRRGYNGQKHFGETTDLYTRFPVASAAAPAKMLENNPDIRLIYVLRNPLARLLSQFHIERTKRYNPPPGDLTLYLHNGTDAISSSRYHYQITRYLESGFTLDRILFLVFEELLADPAGHMRRIAAFLDLEPFEAGPFPHLNGGPGSQRAPSLPKGLYHQLRRALRSDIDAVQEMLGRPIPAWDLSEEAWCDGSAH